MPAVIRNYLTRNVAKFLREAGDEQINLSTMQNLLEPIDNEQQQHQSPGQRSQNDLTNERRDATYSVTSIEKQTNQDSIDRVREKNKEKANGGESNFTERMELDEALLNDAISIGDEDENILDEDNANEQDSRQNHQGFQNSGISPKRNCGRKSVVRADESGQVSRQKTNRNVMQSADRMQNPREFGHEFERNAHNYQNQYYANNLGHRQGAYFANEQQFVNAYGSHPWMRPPPWFDYQSSPIQRNAPAHSHTATRVHYDDGPSQSSYNRLEAVLILDKLPDINGREGSDRIRAFFRKFDLGTDGWTDKEKLKALRSKVDSKAERALNAAVDFESTAARISSREMSFERIKFEMMQALDDLDTRETTAFDDLFTGLQRKNNENIDQLADRVGRTVQRAYPNLSARAIDDLSIKHFLRALDSSDLALTLEVSRTPSMSFDQFVTLASRAESTKRAVQRSTARQPQPNYSRLERNPYNAERPQIFGNNRYQGRNFEQPRKCYNCGKPGHISPHCQEPRANSSSFREVRDHNGVETQHVPKIEPNGNQGQWQPRHVFTPQATGANQTVLSQRPQPNFTTRYNQPNQSMATKSANCIQIDEVPAENKLTIGRIGTNGEVHEWLEELSKLENEGKGRQKIGKLIVFDLFIYGKKVTAMLDGGAQLSLISANSLFKLVKEGAVTIKKENLDKSRNTAFDFNGQKIDTYGVLKIPVNREKLESVEIELFITSASFGFDLLIGTNALGLLGLKLYDEKTDSMIEFECLSENPKENVRNEVRAACNTILAPRSITLVQLILSDDMKDDVIVRSAEESRASFQIEPTAVSTNDKHIIAPIVNYSACKVEVLQNEIVGVAEEVEYILDAGNALSLKSIENVEQINSFQSIEQSVAEKTHKLRMIVPQILGQLNQAEKELIQELILNFGGIFALEDHELTQTDLVTHHVDTGTAPPVKMRVRPVPFAFREKVASMLQDYLERGLIRPSWSPYASPIVLVPKKDGTIRFCVDYRGLNAVTVKDAFPLPNIDNTLMMLGNKKVFSTMDFISGYWQIRMHSDSITKTAFITEFGLYEYLVMPFGMSNAVATFQRFMNRLFEGLNEFVFVYIDDILVASESFTKHLEHLKIVFERIKEAGLKLKIVKCCFVAEELPFLGHILTREGIRKDSDKVRPIFDFPNPKTRKELQSFLGLMTYYRKFVYNFGKIAAPLFRKLKKNTPFILGNEELSAIDMLKSKIAENVVLHFPDFDAAQNDPNRMFVMMTDASKMGVAAVLCQPDESHSLRPIYFASKQCNQAESRYPPTELEALAIWFGVKKFAQFISMIPTRVLTDHRALVPMFKTNGETGNWRVDKWIMQIRSRFILRVEYKPGKSNIVADVLSRNFPNTKNLELLKSETEDRNDLAVIGAIREININGVPEHKIEWQQKTVESELKPLVEFLKSRVLPNDPREVQRVMAMTPFYTLIDGLLYECDKKSGGLRLFVPEKFRQSIMNERHSGKCAAHFGAKKLFLQLSQNYSWPNMWADCNRTVLTCRICAHTRQPRANQPGIQMVKTSEPLELICLDILDIGRSRAKNRYVLVCVDHFSKWTVAEPIPDKSAETVARIFVEKLVLIFGAPRRIHSDRGKEFVNSTLEEMAKILKIGVTTTCGYDAQANGLVERMNQTIIRMLRRTTISEWDWDVKLPYVIFALNVTPSASTSYSPYALMFGRIVKFPTDENVEFETDPWHTMDEDTYLQAFRENLAEILGEARKNAEVAREKNKMEFEARKCVKIGKYSVGDRVMVIFPSEKQKAGIRKLAWNHFGPYKITEMTESSAFVVPIDKIDQNPIKVPLERLIHVPPGIPDISILPGKKNPFRNLIRVMGIFEQFKRYQNDGMEPKNETEEGKKGRKVVVYSLGTTNFSGVGDGEKKAGSQNAVEQNAEESVTKSENGSKYRLGDDTCDGNDGTYQWHAECGGPGHENCRRLALAEFDHVLDRTSELGAMSVKSPLKALLATFVLRELNSNTAARQMTATILSADAGQEWIVFVGNRGNLIPATVLPTTDDLRDALETRFVSCNMANQALAMNAFRPLALKFPATPFQGDELSQWQKLFDQAGWILETIRAKFVHRLPLLETPRVIIGDSTARQLYAEVTNATLISADDNDLAGIVRQFAGVILSSKVRAVLIVLGRDALLSGETMEKNSEYLQRVKALCGRYTHTSVVVWAIPPYVHTRAAAYEQFIELLAQVVDNCHVKLAFMTPRGRSLAELFRYGGTHNGTIVNQTGSLTDAGVRAVLVWLYSVADFPGEKELGRRKSVISQNSGGAQGGRPSSSTDRRLSLSHRFDRDHRRYADRARIEDRVSRRHPGSRR